MLHQLGLGSDMSVFFQNTRNIAFFLDNVTSQLKIAKNTLSVSVFLI